MIQAIPISEEALAKHCDGAIRCGSKSFYAASLMLPAEQRLAARALYAFCRYSDDYVDMPGAASGRADHLHARLDQIYAGQPRNDVVDVAFAKVVQTYNIPKAVPEALIEGFEWDEKGRSYETIDDLISYAVRVAGTVGVMTTLIMGRSDRQVLARASDLGIAMQLTNIARDVGEDARQGRIYLPLTWLRDHNIDPGSLISRPQFTPALATLVKKLLCTADTYYDRAEAGIDHLPAKCRPAIRAAARIYQAIGQDLAAHGFDSVNRRAFSGTGTKMRHMLGSFVARKACAGRLVDPAHSAAAFIVDAAVSSEQSLNQAAHQETGIVRFIGLLQVLEQRERSGEAMRAANRA